MNIYIDPPERYPSIPTDSKLSMQKSKYGLPPKQGLYDPKLEHDACGVAFVAHIKGHKSNQIVKDGLSMLCNLEHRGASGADPKTGDGAGILIQTPHKFFQSIYGEKLPEYGSYACGNVFIPKEADLSRKIKDIVEEAINYVGLSFLGWRKLEVDNSDLGDGALVSEPDTEQILVGRGSQTPELFEASLYRARKRAEKYVNQLESPDKIAFYINSLSSKVIVYKGMFLSYQLGPYYKDLQSELIESALALVHQRFSTNTFPVWKLAHPFRYVAHNGEFNTIEGNINMMRAREYLMKSDKFPGDAIDDLKPIIPGGLSDSASFDCALELMLHTGRSLTHTLAMMVPEAWGSRKHMNMNRRSFYQYHANFMEPWDGPATIAACDGNQIAAILDRNGLRPARFAITKDDRILFASEAGTLPVAEKDIAYKSRLWPGKMILVDIEKGIFKEDDEIKAEFINKKPYKSWLENGLVELGDLPDPITPPKPLHNDLKKFQRAFGYTEESLKSQLVEMAVQGIDPVGSMGNDAPLAILSRLPKPLYHFFRQRFAQVTNPPIDPIREELVMSLPTYIGSPWNVFSENETLSQQLRIPQPILSNYELEQIAQSNTDRIKGITLPMLFKAEGGLKALREGIDNLFKTAAEKIREGYNAIVLSDRQMNEEMAPMPAIVALSGLHHYLIRNNLRGSVGLIVETGEAHLVHDMAVLVGYGASAINPYMVFESIRNLRDHGVLPPAQNANEDDYEDVCAHYDRNYIKAVTKGIQKIMSKMGISALRSYRGAQTFEIIGFSKAIVDEFFTGTVSNIEGMGLSEICQGILMKHRSAFAPQPDINRELDWGGEHKWRPTGEHHLMNPESIALLQHAARTGSYETFKKFTKKIDDQSYFLSTIRGLLKFKKIRPSISIDEVEPISSIVKRFCTGAMSLGSISTEAHETLALAMNEIGGKSNTGEGGEDVRRFKPDHRGNRCSAIKQVASGRFGVTPYYLSSAREIQIKISQGAKPGEGGQLPGHKVDNYIAKLRHSVPGVSLISPPPHHDIYSIEDLAQLIYDLKNSNPQADINVKLVAESGVGTVAAGVAKAHAEIVTIAGHDGGTGASPISSIKQAGGPWELGVAETHQTLVLNNLRSRIRIQADGQLRTGRDVVIAALLGAEEFGFATIALIAMGCIMMRKCHLNTCPVGIATQDKRLIEYFKGQPAHVVNYFTFLSSEVREIMAELGFRSIQEMIGKTETLELDETRRQWKSQGVDLSRLLHKVESSNGSASYCVEAQNHNLESILDQELIRRCESAIAHGAKVSFSLPIKNTNRTVGTMLSGRVAAKYGDDGLPEGTIDITFTGISGQSFGAFLAPGINLTLIGEANDYVGKGMGGGQIVVKKSPEATFKSDENWIAGNTLLYGATSGKIFINGRAGERFAVRNSGVIAVVEGVGDHGCEYMTGGIVVVLGHTGRNFAAGMSGGVAYVMDPDRLFSRRCNHGMVDIEQMEEEDYGNLKSLIEEHAALTESVKAQNVLSNWNNQKTQFVKVMPREYRRILAQMQEESK
jgi:glutamate synthase domain-containing protein 2/glutamate synthase domain-containing protein 1/glutamate synthase domain-containing protein 3